MKKILSIFLSLLLTAALLPAASAADSSTEIEYLENGMYYVTVLQEEDRVVTRSSTTVTKSKTKTAYSASDKALWYVKVTGSFTYGDGSSKCNSATASAGAYVSDWRINSKSSSKSGNKATATATATEYMGSTPLYTVTASVTLTCSTTGKFS